MKIAQALRNAIPERTYYVATGKLAGSCNLNDHGPDLLPSDDVDGTLVGSSTGRYSANGPMHMPAIDIDLPCRLMESSTPGHYHLYIDHEITWDSYKEILAALNRAGIVQRGFYNSALRRQQTFLRRPGVRKEDT